MATANKDAKQTITQTPRRGWFRRNGRRFVVVLLVVVVGIAAGSYWWLIGRIHNLDIYRTSMQTIEKDKGLRQELGHPIEAAFWPPPSPRLEERERDIRWDVEGPKGRAGAHVFARLMEGKWEITTLEVTLQNGKRVSLSENVGGGDDAPPFKNEAPPFKSSKPDEKKSNEKGPGPDINMPVPPDIPGPDVK